MTVKKSSDLIYRHIEEKILSGEWKPGDRIQSEIKLAEEFGVSRVTVREAIGRMVALGILSKVQGGGTYINELSPAGSLSKLEAVLMLDKDNYLDILEFRQIIESECTRLCAERLTDDILAELEASLQDMKTHANESDRFAREDARFHLAIARGSGNPLLYKTYMIMNSLMTHHQMRLHDYLGAVGGIHDHQLILDAIRQHDGEIGRIYSQRHIARTIADVKAYLAANSQL